MSGATVSASRAGATARPAPPFFLLSHRRRSVLTFGTTGRSADDRLGATLARARSFVEAGHQDLAGVVLPVRVENDRVGFRDIAEIHGRANRRARAAASGSLREASTRISMTNLLLNLVKRLDLQRLPPAVYCDAEPLLDVYLIDGTYELFRHYYALPAARDRDGMDVAAVRGVVASVLGMIGQGARFVGVATDHVIESFRNDLWPGYKTSAGIEPDLLSQFGLLEEALTAANITVWPMVEFEADDALASAAAKAALDPRVERVIICTPDKDLAQCVRGTRVVQLNRRTRHTLDESGVVKKFGVPPASIPDYLALVGDAADGYPGLPGWGAKSTAAVLARFGHLESIPADWRTWHVNAANPAALAATLERERERAFLFRRLATLRSDLPVFDSVDELAWTGPSDAFAAIAERLERAVPDPAARPREASDTPVT